MLEMRAEEASPLERFRRAFSFPEERRLMISRRADVKIAGFNKWEGRLKV